VKPLTWQQILKRYGIEWIVVSPSRIRSSGAQSCGIIWPNTVAIPTLCSDISVFNQMEGIGADDILHEAMHLVCAVKRTDIDNDCEGCGLMQLERAIADLMSPKDRAAVHEYQAITRVVEDVRIPRDIRPHCHFSMDGIVDVGRRPTTTAWWKRGTERAIEWGLLDVQGNPTWKRRTLR